MSTNQSLGPQDAEAGPTVRRQAARLLRQLGARRPRRELDIEAARSLLEAIAAPADVDALIADLIRSAWEWGVSCEVDGVRWGEAGDSYNQMLRDHTQAAANRLQAYKAAQKQLAFQCTVGGVVSLCESCQQLGICVYGGSHTNSHGQIKP